MRVDVSLALAALLSIGPLAVVGAEGEAGSEPILSDGFEGEREAWQPVGIGAIDTEHSHGGGASLRLEDESDEKYFTTSRTLPVEPDSLYQVSFLCLSRDGEHASLCIVQRQEDGQPAERDGKHLTHWSFPFHDGGKLGEWVQATHTFTTGPETDRCSLILNPADGSPEHTGTAWFDDISVRYAGKAIQPAEKSMPLKPLGPLEIDLGSDECTIVCPGDDAVRAAAERLAVAIERKTQRKPRLVDDSTDPASLGRGPLLVMGNLALSVVGRKLYFEGYDFTDYAWPGQGGYVVRTVRDPFGTGAHVLMIGGSYPEDIVSAAARTEEIVATRGPTLGYLNEVKLGKNADVIEAWSSEFLKDDAEWKRSGSLGSWEYLWRIGKAGMGYLRTGNEAYLEPFKRELLYFFEHDVFNRTQESPPQIHSLIDAVLLPWDLLADHPFFTADKRRDIDEKFLFLACSHEGPRALKGAGWGLRGNHGLGKALDGYWLGRYFWRRYAIEEAREWFDIVDRYFAPQLLSSKPTEDGGYHQYKASLLCTLMYALAAGKDDYLTGRALQEATDRAILEYAIGKGPMAYLGARAVAADDPGYLALMADAGKDEYIRRCAGMGDASLLGENLRSFCGFEAPQEKSDLLGAKVAPLDPMWHDRMRARTEGTEFVVTTAPEESYDKIVIRDSYQPEGFYLKIDGLGCGGHSFQDANCITAYRERGVPWLCEEYGYKGPTCSTLRQQNGVFVALNGQGPPGVHVCARLLYARELGDDLDALGGALEGIGDLTWERHLLRKRGAWTLVIDRATTAKQGELFVERHWHIRPWGTPGEFSAQDGTVVCRHGDVAFHLQSVGLPPEAMIGTSNRTEIVRADVPADGHVDIASLIFVDHAPEEGGAVAAGSGPRGGPQSRYQLTRTPEGWRVTDAEDDSAIGVTLGTDGLTVASAAAPARVAAPPDTLPLEPEVPTVSLPWRQVQMGDEVTAVATGHDCFAGGTRNGTVAVFELDGTQRWQAKVGTWVLSLHFLGEGLLVGEDDGTLSRLDASGNSVWSVNIPYAHIGWPHWSDQRSRIREITAADIDGDGEREILVSNGDRRLYAFTGSGEQLWKKGVHWGVCIALTPTTYLGKFALFSGVTGPTLGGRVKIHDAQANLVGRLQISGMHSQQIRDVRLFDLTGDGKREIVVARDINSNQLVVCNEDRSLLWKADVGGSPDALAIRSYEGARQVLCGSRCGYVHAFEGATGHHLWFCYLGDEPRLLWPRADGSILAVCPSGSVVFAVGADGGLAGCETLPAPITALLRPGQHRADPSCIPVGTNDGTIHVLEIGER